MSDAESSGDEDPKLTVVKLIELLKTLPPDAPIGYADFTGYDNIQAYVGEDGEVIIGPV